jgi:hypothetical protein
LQKPLVTLNHGPAAGCLDVKHSGGPTPRACHASTPVRAVCHFRARITPESRKRKRF